MREITMYRADDGSVWHERARAEERDIVYHDCRKMEERYLLPAPNHSSQYGSGHGYIQQSPANVKILYDFLKSQGAERDSDGPIGKLLNRMWRIDDQGREWGQGYFALNPDKAPVCKPFWEIYPDG